VAGIGVGGLVAFTRSTVDALDALNDVKDATGASIENISALEDVAARTGTTMDTVTGSLIKLNQTLNAAKEGSPQAAALQAIGLSAEELRRLDPAEALRRIAVALAGFADALERTPIDAVTLPGCWPKGVINDAEAHWRFVGSCWVCPARLAGDVYRAVREVVTLRTEMTGRLSWDMNSMAYVELLDILPIHWYPANHDQTQFTNYGR
jgi:hypothetical protein